MHWMAIICAFEKVENRKRNQKWLVWSRANLANKITIRRKSVKAEVDLSYNRDNCSTYCVYVRIPRFWSLVNLQPRNH